MGGRGERLKVLRVMDTVLYIECRDMKHRGVTRGRGCNSFDSWDGGGGGAWASLQREKSEEKERTGAVFSSFYWYRRLLAISLSEP
jgi:hypothetical protein